MSSFWRNVTSVFSGVFIAQLIPIAASLFITRIFQPEAFGDYSAWLGVVTFISIVITLRLEAAIVLIEKVERRIKAVLYVFTISTILFTFIFIIILMVLLLSWVDFSRLDFVYKSFYLILILAPAALFFALNQVWQAWAVAEGYYRKLNIMRIVQALLVAVLQVVIGFIYPTALSLAISFTVASMLSLFFCFLLMPNVFIIKNINIVDFKVYIKRYRSFPKFALPADAINTAAAQLPVIIIAYRFGADIAGLLALTMRVLGAPIGLIGKAILDVFKKDAVQNMRDYGNCKKLYINTFFVLSFASIALSLGTVFLGEIIFKKAFGPQWEASGAIAIWLLPLFALRFIASPLSYMAYIVEKQYVDLYWQAGLLVMTCFTLLFFSDYKETIIIYGAGYAFMYIIYLNMSYSFSKGSVK